MDILPASMTFERRQNNLAAKRFALFRGFIRIRDRNIRIPMWRDASGKLISIHAIEGAYRFAIFFEHGVE
jgi:hypothetical protein